MDLLREFLLRPIIDQILIQMILIIEKEMNLNTLFKSNTRENIIVFTDKGNMYQTKGINIPEFKWKEKGERIDLLLKL